MEDAARSGDAAGRPVWTAGQVAAHLRIAESTLRSWHRRYGVGPRAEQPGRYRRYTAGDIARLRRMYDLIKAGMLPSDAARIVGAAVPGSTPLEELLPEVLGAARRLDNDRCLAVLGQALDWCGVVEVWERLCRPALLAVEAEQRDDPGLVDAEHVLSWAIAAALHRADRPPAAAGRPLVMLACTEGEQHTLALEALAAALAERRTPVRMLGAAVPAPILVHAVATARPAVVVLWSHRPQTARPDALRALAEFTDRAPRPVVGGPGWPRRPAGAEVVASLPAAVALLGD